MSAKWQGKSAGNSLSFFYQEPTLVVAICSWRAELQCPHHLLKDLLRNVACKLLTVANFRVSFGGNFETMLRVQSRRSGSGEDFRKSVSGGSGRKETKADLFLAVSTLH